MSDAKEPAAEEPRESEASSAGAAPSVPGREAPASAMPGDEEGPTSTVKTSADADSPVEPSDVAARRSLHANFIAWLDSRTGILGLAHEMLYEHIPGGSRWRYVWGSTLVFAFVVQVITGTVLWMHYSPSDTTAWESVYYIQHEMQGGWLLRGIHHFMAQAMVVLLGLAPAAGGDRRRVQGPARDQLLARPDPDADRAGPVADRLPAAVGPEGLLGHPRGHQPDGPRAAGGRAAAGSWSSAARTTGTTR